MIVQFLPTQRVEMRVSAAYLLFRRIGFKEITKIFHPCILCSATLLSKKIAEDW